MDRVKALRPLLHEITGRHFELNENVQDASFLTDLAIYSNERTPQGGLIRKAIVAVRFSAFGRLFTVWSVCREDQRLDPEITTRIIRCVEERGYTYVDVDSLDEPYSGPNPHLEEGISWWNRFFDYL
jgi:hypothetical protein